MDRMDCMILQGAFTCFYLAAVLRCDGADQSGCGAAAGEGWSTAEEVAAAAAHLTIEEQLRLTRMLFDRSRV